MHIPINISKLSPADQVKLKRLRAAIALGMKDIEEGRVAPWDAEEVLKSARTRRDQKLRKSPIQTT